MVSDLEPGLTYYYKVKAFYTDGTESEWSNFECVTLLADTPENERGDVNGDHNVNISDVTALINYLLTKDASSIDPDAANCNHDGEINIADVTALTNYLLSGNWSN